MLTPFEDLADLLTDGRVLQAPARVIHLRQPKARGFLSKSITVAAMHQQSGDINHIVPKDYLQKNGFPDHGDYNQVANVALTETSSTSA